MLSRFIAVLHERQPHLKSEWVERLRTEPVSSAMAEPVILAHLMDETLGQFYSLLRRKPDSCWLHTHPALLSETTGSCRCGLNPLLAYFATGQEAVDTELDAADMKDERERGRLMFRWHFLAQREIETLCTACVQTCPVANRTRSYLKSGEPPGPASLDATDPGTPSAAHPRCGETPG